MYVCLYSVYSVYYTLYKHVCAYIYVYLNMLNILNLNIT